MNTEIEAYIMSGGMSSRFGEQKAVYLYEGKPLIHYAYDILKAVFPKVYAVNAFGGPNSIEGIPAIQDLIPNMGPIGGIHAALTKAQTDKIFVCPCDMPFLEEGLVEYMTQLPDYYDIVVPIISGKFEPLHAIYSKKCLTKIEELIGNNVKKITQCYSSVELREVIEDEILYYGDPEKIFQNINYQSDLG